MSKQASRHMSAMEHARKTSSAEQASEWAVRENEQAEKQRERESIPNTIIIACGQSIYDHIKMHVLSAS